MTSEPVTPRLRTFLAAILCFGLVGSGTELMLLDHHEDFKQAMPLGLIASALAALVWHALAKSRASVRGLQLVMSLFIAAGLAGVVFHLQGTLEFQREIDPSLKGLELMMKAFRAKAPPALAPGVMIQLGLIGLAFAYRHPALRGPTGPTPQNGA